ncbi:MAG: xanthine dehydrogenase accessory protein XdhC [Cohaesibacter sp.]|jgi:xanthine dehydrogenase accessory factor|nr:xanthine dehydrogenase accessory protein XdhC [Cohaesibacter sp.]
MIDLVTLLSSADPVMQVRLASVKGSSPREEGACLYVSARAVAGTIGGGQLEYMAIDKARALLRYGTRKDSMTVPLGPEIGQCCGGHVVLDLKVLSERDKKACLDAQQTRQQTQPQVYIFGAGHLGRALAACLSLLPVTPLLIDSRKGELDLCKTHIKKCCTPLPETMIRQAPAHTAFVIATHDHGLDFLLAAEALARCDAAYVGMIGSKTKRATFRSWLAAHDPALSSASLACPMGAREGAKVADKRPEVIAAMIAAELLETFLGTDAQSKMAKAEQEPFAQSPDLLDKKGDQAEPSVRTSIYDFS